MATLVRALAWAALPGLHGLHACPWSEPWEWAGVFHIHEGGTLLWGAEKKNGDYEAASMKLVIRTTSRSDHQGIHDVEPADTAWDSATRATTHTLLIPNNAYILEFDTESWISLFKIEAQAETNLVFFAEHLPTEFMGRMDTFLIDQEGHELKAVDEESAAACLTSQQEPKGTIGGVIGAALLSMMPTLVVIFAIFCSCSGKLSEKSKTVLHYVNAGASGILFGAAVFLLLPESHHMLGTIGTESAGAAAWGGTIIAGWLAGALTHQIGSAIVQKYSPRPSGPSEAGVRSEGSSETADSETAIKSEGESMESEARSSAKWYVALPVLFGDFFCNLADGFVIGVAFRLCGPAFGWEVAAITLAHEMPQELADFFVLIHEAQLSWWKATLLNVLIGSACLFGAIFAFYLDTSAIVEGAILAAGGGVFLFVSLTELGPHVSHVRKTASAPFLSGFVTALAFVFGTCTMGLVLLNHQHCLVPAGGEAHAGNDHGHDHGHHHGHGH